VPPLCIDTPDIASRLAALAEVALCPVCELPITQIAADLVDLTVEVARLSGAVIEARRESANRLAAIRAALSAATDGEADPWGFLQDALAESPGVQITGDQRGWSR
jgi:hypothetical protein